MPVFKDEKTNKWYAMVRFTDWQGQRKQKCKRGFATRRDALEWEKVFQMQTTSDMDMSFEAFVELYKAERQPRLKQTTWMTKEHIINTKILPYFGKRRISEIQSKDVIAWQNKLLLMKDEKGKFNALRNVQDDRTGDARRVISAYANIFVLIVKGLYEIDNDFDWRLESVIKLLKEGNIRSIKTKDTYYRKLKEFLDRINKDESKDDEENQEDKSLIGIATSNYTPLIEKCTSIEPIYLHGRLNWFEDYERLRVYDAYDESDVVCERKQYVFPFIMIPSGVKPLICQKQIEEYDRFLKLLSESNLL